MNVLKRGKKRSTKSVSLYANLSNRRKANRDLKKRRKAEYLATLPKHPVKRLFYRLHPKRFFGYWFSKDGLLMMLKIFGVSMAVLALIIGILFLYYRRELDAIRPDEIAKRVQTTVTTYTDRNGVVLWEDKGDGDYKLVVKSDDISKHMKNATVAIEDKDFYKHGGFSASGIVRAAWSNFTNSGSTQGGSTLTQQLIKQVFFADEAGNRGLSGVPRKIKEVILSIQVEGIYNKDQILTLYLNESPYGGRRNGVESAAQTYFGKSAKDLTIAESALLAAIPQNPTYYNPYNSEGHKALIERQHTVLDYMVEQGYIEKAEADEAKKVAVLDTIKPESDQFSGIKAPHFVQMVKSDLESELGKKTVGDGGLTVKTTLDYRAQEIMEREMTALFETYKPKSANFDNGAATMVDSQTGQILGLVGSRGYDYPGYGAVNAATAWIQPGSSIKPFVYASLFKQRDGTNWGAGSILADEPLPQTIYKTDDGKSVNNFDNKFRGSIPIRSGLAESRNIPAIKAMYINDRDNGAGDTLKTIQALGDKSYCSQNDAGLALSIGGCELKMVEHVNTFATIARMGVYKPTASVLEVKNSQGQVIKQWKDTSEQVIDPQITYMLADILSDDAARAPSFGRGASGLNVPNVKTGTKTGTSNLGNWSKDLWMNSFSPKATLSFWVGNHDSRYMSNALSSLVGPSVGAIMHDTHVGIFQPDGTWKPGDWFTQPAGIQRLTVNGRTDLFPSWYNKKTSTATGNEKMVFDRASKKRATDCTPDAARVELDVTSSTDPITNKKTYTAPDGYDPNSNDTLHQCNDSKPFINNVSINKNKKEIAVNVTQGTHTLQSISVTVGDTPVGTVSASGSGTYTLNYPASVNGNQSITVTVTDIAYYSTTMTPANDNF